MRSALLLASVFVLAACDGSANARRDDGAPASGQGGERSFALSGFRSVSVAGPFNVVVTVGQPHSIRAEGDPEMLDRLKIALDGDALEIGTRKGLWEKSFRHKGRETVIHVTMPAIEAAEIAGSGDLKVDRVEGRRFAASIAGSGDIEIGTIRVGEAKFDIAGSGSLRAAGTATTSSVSIAGSGDVDVERLEVRNAALSTAGSGDIGARAIETAEVSIMGSGDVSVAGPAKCSVTKMGSGSFRCGS